MGLLLLAFVAGCDFGRGSQARDLEGNRVDVVSKAGSNAVVLIFVATQCPIANRYVPEMKRLHERFTGKGIQFYFVYPDRDVSAGEIREHMKLYGLPGEALRDPNHALVRAAQARVTPEAAVFQGGKLVYHGRIDDRFPAFGTDRGAATERNLERVLEAVTKGEAAVMESKPAVGCVIPQIE